jgi:hypothetical protein
LAGSRVNVAENSSFWHWLISDVWDEENQTCRWLDDPFGRVQWKWYKPVSLSPGRSDGVPCKSLVSLGNTSSRWAEMQEDFRKPVLEALVQKTIGFVDDQEPEVLKGKVWRRGEVVHQSTRGSNQDVDLG